MKRLLSALLVCALFATQTFADKEGDAAEKLRPVRVIYLVSRDREEKPEYTEAIEHAIRDLQVWYAKQLGGPTFRLNDPVVEVVKSGRFADWFYSNPNGPNEDSWGFNNTLEEAGRVVGAKHNDPNYIWVIYSDGPGNKGRGGSGVTCLPEDDLLGLVGKHPKNKNKLRWIAGLGHEVGHAFGLPHPDDTVKYKDAIMWTGIYGLYPDKTYLTPDDKKILMRSPFFYKEDDTPVFAPVVTEEYTYRGGAFRRHGKESPVVWSEVKTNGSENHTFEETSRDEKQIVITDKGRGISVRIPVDGGRCHFSNNGGESWNPLYVVKLKEEAGT